MTLYDAGGRPVQQVDHRPGPVLDVAVAGTAAGRPPWEAAGPSRGTSIPRPLGGRRGILAGHAGDVVEALITADGGRLVTAARTSDDRVGDVTASAGFGASLAGLGDRWFAGPPEVVEPGRLVVVPTRPVAALDDGRRRRTRRVSRRRFSSRAPVASSIRSPWGPSTTPNSCGRRWPSVPTAGWSPSPPGCPRRSSTRGRGSVWRRSTCRPTVTSAATGARCVRTWCHASRGPRTPRGSCSAARGVRTTASGATVVVDPTTGSVEREAPLGAIVAEAAATSRDHRRLALAQLDAGLVMVLDAGTLRAEQAVPVFGSGVLYRGPATDISFSPDGRRIAVTAQSRDLFVVDTTTWTPSRDRIPVGSALPAGRVAGRQPDRRARECRRDALVVRHRAPADAYCAGVGVERLAGRPRPPGAGNRRRGGRHERGETGTALAGGQEGLAGAGLRTRRARPHQVGVDALPPRASLPAHLQRSRVAVACAQQGYRCRPWPVMYQQLPGSSDRTSVSTPQSV